MKPNTPRLRAAAAVSCALIAPIVLALAVSCAQGRSAAEAGRVLAEYKGVGVVVAVDTEKGKVKINHEKIEGFMDAMTMWFHVEDKTLLDGIAPDDRVEFTLVERERGYSITALGKL